MDAMKLVADERARQVAKGYDAAHDDGHADGSLGQLAAFLVEESDVILRMPEWAADYADHIDAKHGRDRIKMLTIAAALIVAEIERIQRTATEPPKPPH